MIPNDAHARQEALDPTKSFIVQAPAGSGKTETLSQRYLNLLAIVDAPEEIIALTFTNKAASEMQQRIYQALLNAQNMPEPVEPHQQLTHRLAQKALTQSTWKKWQLLNNPKRLRIMTIDAFCQSLSQQLIFETDEAFSAEISETPELLYEQAIDQFIADTDEQSPYYQDFYLLLSHLDNDITRVRQLLSSMLTNREQWLGILLHAELISPTGDKSKSIIESGFYALFIKLTQQAVTLLSLEENHLMFQEILQFCDEQNRQNDQSKSNQQNTDRFAFDKCNPIFWQKFIKLLFTNENTFRNTFNAKQGLPVRDAKAQAYIQWLMEYTAQFSDTARVNIYVLISELRLYERLSFDAHEWQILSAIARIALRLTQYLKLVFKQQALLDFNEVSLQALSALGSSENPTNLMLYLDHQIKHLLIDEFQDTSILQFKLLQMLTLEWQPCERKTLFIVGDPMQSIYRFRQAEVNQFLEVKAQGINQIKLKFLQLNCNFRSQKSIVDWVNQSFCAIFPSFDDMNYGGISYSHASSLSQEINDNAVTCTLFDNMEQEALHIANEIKAYLSRYPTHQVAILLRTRSHLQTLVPILKAHNIDLVENEIETFYHQPMVMDLTCLCAILINSEQAIYWVSLLQSDLFGFSLNELNQIEKIKHHDESTYSFYQKLKKYLQLNQTHTHEQKALYLLSWLDHDYFSGLRSSLPDRLKIIWRELDGFAIYPNSALYESFLSLLDKHLTQDKSAIAHFDRFIEILKRKFVSFPSKSNVFIMTIHKSKGLEFDFVILPQLDKRGKVDDTSLFLHETVCLSDRETYLLLSPIKHSWDTDSPALYKVIQNMQKKRAAYELQRLLYVAVTRAKSKLLLTAVHNKEVNNVQNNSFLALLEPLNLSWIATTNANEMMMLDENIKSTPTYYKLIRQIQNYSMSPIPKLNNYLSLESDDLNHPDFEALVLSKERQIGLVLHQLFNFICLNPFHIHNWQDYFAVCLHQHAVAKELQSEALSQANLAIDNTVSQFSWIFDAQGMSEQVMLNLDFGRRQKNIADRIVVDNGLYHIIDYKFVLPHANESLQSFLATQKAQYSAQLTHYQRLLASYLKLDQQAVKTSLYFPLIPQLHAVSQ